MYYIVTSVFTCFMNITGKVHTTIFLLTVDKFYLSSQCQVYQMPPCSGVIYIWRKTWTIDIAVGKKLSLICKLNKIIWSGVEKSNVLFWFISLRILAIGIHKIFRANEQLKSNTKKVNRLNPYNLSNIVY